VCERKEGKEKGRERYVVLARFGEDEKDKKLRNCCMRLERHMMPHSILSKCAVWAFTLEAQTSDFLPCEILEDTC
jgi:hypothetical protein